MTVIVVTKGGRSVGGGFSWLPHNEVSSSSSCLCAPCSLIPTSSSIFVIFLSVSNKKYNVILFIHVLMACTNAHELDVLA